jgi:hypothetical protein
MTRKPVWYSSKEGWHVEVAIIAENGKLTLVNAETKKQGLANVPTITGLAYFDLWAHIIPTGFEPGDYRIQEVYGSSQSSAECQQLTGELFAEAKKILLADEEWRDWAHQEITEQECAA